MSDRAGNDERLAFLYDSSKLTLLEEAGEVAFPPRDNARVSLTGDVRRRKVGGSGGDKQDRLYEKPRCARRLQHAEG